MDSRNEDVARRAYELFLARGAEHGDDVADWLEAERQLLVNGGPRGRGQRVVSQPRAPKTSVRRKTR